MCVLAGRCIHTRVWVRAYTCVGAAVADSLASRLVGRKALVLAAQPRGFRTSKWYLQLRGDERKKERLLKHPSNIRGCCQPLCTHRTHSETVRQRWAHRLWRQGWWDRLGPGRATHSAFCFCFHNLHLHDHGHVTWALRTLIYQLGEGAVWRWRSTESFLLCSVPHGIVRLELNNIWKFF